jgi:molecular chaperone HtpG
VVDSEDLPLNVSREMLQQNKIMSVIRKNIVKKCIEMFQDIADKEDPAEYKTFYDNFHQSIKLGIHEDDKNRDKLIKLLRFQTAKSPESTLTSLADYVSTSCYADNMPNDVIYYITGSSRKGLENSPFVKGILEQGHDVLLMVDSIDEYMVQQVKEFEGKKLVNISKDNSMFQTTDEELEKTVGKLIKDILPNEIEKVVVSNRLGSAPCCLVSSEYGWSANMERIVKAQTLNTPSQMMFAGNNKKIMEINPTHAIIKRLQQSVNNSDMSNTSRNDVVRLLYDTALLNSGYTQEDTSSFVDRVLKMMMVGLDVEQEEPVKEEEPPVKEEEPPAKEEEPKENMEEVD